MADSRAAAAHAALASSTPAKMPPDTAPAEIKLTFTENLEETFFALTVMGRAKRTGHEVNPELTAQICPLRSTKPHPLVSTPSTTGCFRRRPPCHRAVSLRADRPQHNESGAYEPDE